MIDAKQYAIGCYRDTTACNVLALFLLKENNQSIKKLCNLMYEVERFCMSYANDLVVVDAVFRTKSNGFIPKLTYEHIRGDLDGIFADWFVKPTYDTLALKDGITEDAIINISDYDADIVADVWDFYGHLDADEMAKWFLKNHPETGRPIDWVELLGILGMDTDKFKESQDVRYSLHDCDSDYDVKKAELYAEMMARH